MVLFNNGPNQGLQSRILKCSMLIKYNLVCSAVAEPGEWGQAPNGKTQKNIRPLPTHFRLKSRVNISTWKLNAQK